MNLFDFTEEDLKSNQRGQVSPRQREWLNMTAQHPQFFVDRCICYSWFSDPGVMHHSGAVPAK